MFRCAQRFQHRRQLLDRQHPTAPSRCPLSGAPDAAHARPAAALSSDSICQGSHTVGVSCRRTISFSSTPETRHQQDVRPDVRIAQRNRFVQRSHAEPFRPSASRRASIRPRLPVSIGLHHGADGHFRSNVLLHRTEILPKGGQRNVCPCGTRRRPAQDFCCVATSAIIAGASGTQVTLGLLPLVTRECQITALHRGLEDRRGKRRILKCIHSLVQYEVHRNLCLHFDGFAIEHIRPIPPLAHGFHRRVHQHRVS